MDWEMMYWIGRAEILHNEEKDEYILSCQVPEAREGFMKLMDGATQVSLDFDGGMPEGESSIGFVLRNANGEMFLGLRKRDWPLLLEQPDTLFFVYGDGDKDLLQTTFFNRMFDEYIDRMIERYNEGDRDPFILDIITVFAEDEEDDV